MSWRDQFSSAAQDDLDGLVDTVLPFAQQMLAQHGEFFPYGAVVSADGRVEILAASRGADQRPGSDEHLRILYSAAQSTSATTRATAFVSDVRLDGSTPSDAIRVELEHRDGLALTVLLPYRRKRRKVEYGDMSAQTGDRRVWTDDV
jgi:hypothetical protein